LTQSIAQGFGQEQTFDPGGVYFSSAVAAASLGEGSKNAICCLRVCLFLVSDFKFV